MDQNVFIAIIACIAFGIRALPRMLYPSAYNYDTYFHVHLAQQLKANTLKGLEVIPVNRTYPAMYPLGYHYFLAIFPKQMIRLMERVSSPLFDTLILLSLYGAIHLFWGINGLPVPEMFAETVCLLYAFSPALLRVGSGPRAYSGTPRVLGQLLYFIHICLAYTAITMGSIPLGLTAAAIMCLFPLVAKFTMQVAVFFAIPMAILMGKGYAFIFLLGAGGIFTIPACRAYFLEHIQFIINYYKKTRHGFIGFTPGTWKNYIESVKNHGLKKIQERKYVRFLFWCLDEQFFPHYLVVCQLPVLLLFFSADPEVIPSALQHILTGWVACGFLWGTATKTKWLMPVGEGERYIEYCYPTLLLAATACAWGNPLLVGLLYIVTIPLGMVCIYRVIKRIQPLEGQYEEYKEAYDFLNSQPDDGEVLPIGYVAYPGLLFSQKDLHGFLSDPKRCLLTDEEFHLLRKTYPLPDPDLKTVTSHFGTTYIVAQQWAWNDYIKLMPDNGASLVETKPIFSSEGMIIFLVDDLRLEHAHA